VKATMLGALWFDEIFRRTDASGPRTFLTDGLGSTMTLTDDAGVARTQYRFDPYGATIASGDASSNRFQYTGRENDGAGLYYYRARYYSPSFGRFISEDPRGLEEGLNLYSYVRQDPLNNVDPDGQVVVAIGPVLEFTPGAGGLLGGGIAISFPTPWDPCTPWDIGAFGTVSGRVGLSAGLSLLSVMPGSFDDFRGGSIDFQAGGNLGPLSVGYSGSSSLRPGQGVGPWEHSGFGQIGPNVPGLPVVGLPKLGGRVGASGGLTFTGVSSLNEGSGSGSCGCN
jgi:RHS repeat-associated protein